jgi:hypothetical protein
MARDKIKLHYQPLILKQAGQLPTVPNPTTGVPGDTTWVEETDLLIGQTAYNIVDNRIYIRNGNEIMPFKETMYHVHDQPVLSDEWHVLHKLGFRPAVTVIDEDGYEVEAEVEGESTMDLTVRFNKPTRGRVYLT